MNLLDLM